MNTFVPPPATVPVAHAGPPRRRRCLRTARRSHQPPANPTEKPGRGRKRRRRRRRQLKPQVRTLDEEDDALLKHRIAELERLRDAVRREAAKAKSQLRQTEAAGKRAGSKGEESCRNADPSKFVSPNLVPSSKSVVLSVTKTATPTPKVAVPGNRRPVPWAHVTQRYVSDGKVEFGCLATKSLTSFTVGHRKNEKSILQSESILSRMRRLLFREERRGRLVVGTY